MSFLSCIIDRLRGNRKKRTFTMFFRGRDGSFLKFMIPKDAAISLGDLEDISEGLRAIAREYKLDISKIMTGGRWSRSSYDFDSSQESVIFHYGITRVAIVSFFWSKSDHVLGPGDAFFYEILVEETFYRKMDLLRSFAALFNSHLDEEFEHLVSSIAQT